MVDLIPRAVLFGNPERVSPRVSPDGTRLAWLAPDEGVLNVWVASLDMRDATPVTDDRDRGIRTFLWAHDGRHLLYLQDRGGDENWRLYDVDLETMATRDLTPFEGVQAQVLAVDKLFPDEVLVGLNRDNEQLHDVYHLDLVSGQLDKVVDNPGMVGWVADADFVVRAGLAPEPDGGFVLMVRDDAEADWRPFQRVPAEDALSSWIVAFTEDGGSLYAVSSIDANTGRLVRTDLGTGTMDVIAADPVNDVTDVRLQPDSRQVQVVTFVRERADYLVLDPAVEEDVAAIRSLHPGDPNLEGNDDADVTWLVGFTNDSGPVPYFAYDRRTRTGRLLFEHQPSLSNYQLAAMEPFSYQARDGLVIHGYLTFPVGEPREALPTVLNVHGGPWARDLWGFQPEGQWLANRGYLCVQVNYRGSTGYGKEFVNAGDREWGGKMHDDLVDAVAWVVDHGFADPARIAIYGGSYGGYAALVGATFTPELFRAAIDVVGPSNLDTLIRSIPPYWAPLIAQFHTRVGNPNTDAEFLWLRSPLSRVKDIKVPLLIAQGANDPRVKQAESEQIVAALTDAGIDYEYLLFPDEGHGFAKPENRLRFYAAAERFLARHLGGRAED
jgi:dipeptidyl aminopeptidase/acylaminoacyl peptidase